LDDLMGSTASVLTLLAAILTKFEDMGVGSVSSRGVDLSDAVPRLFRFMRHLLPIVRQACLNALDKVVAGAQASSAWFEDVMPVALAHLLETLVLEEQDSLRVLTLAVVRRICDKTNPSTLSVALTRHLTSWIELVTTPTGTPIDSSLLRSNLSGIANPTFEAKRRKAEPSTVMRLLVGGATQAITPKYAFVLYWRYDGVGVVILCMCSRITWFG
jgi:hypothetical protein